MKHQLITWVAKRSMTFVLLLSLALVGLGHKMQGPALTSDPAVLAYLAAGGALSDICGTLGDGDLALHAECAACLLKSCFALPEPAGEFRIASEIAAFRLDLEAHDIAPPRRVLDISRATRAPPAA